LCQDAKTYSSGTLSSPPMMPSRTTAMLIRSSPITSPQALWL
jgi:hypothetical protein